MEVSTMFFYLQILRFYKVYSRARICIRNLTMCTVYGDRESERLRTGKRWIVGGTEIITLLQHTYTILIHTMY